MNSFFLPMSLIKYIIDKYFKIFCCNVGGDAFMVAGRRSLTPDDSHPSALARGGPEVPYGDVVRRTP